MHRLGISRAQREIEDVMLTRYVCYPIAQKCDPLRKIGRFESSSRDAIELSAFSMNATLLACSACVDLNPIRAAMAEVIEQSDFTSAQRRIESIQVASMDRLANTGSLPDCFLTTLTI